MRDFPSQFVPDDRPVDQRNVIVLHGVKLGGVRNNLGELIPTITFLGCDAGDHRRREVTLVIETEEAWHELASAVSEQANGAFGPGGWATRVDPRMN